MSTNMKNENQIQMQMSKLDKGKNKRSSTNGSSSKRSQHQCCIIPFVLVLLLLVPDLIVALKDVSVTIPQAVKRGSNAQLTCNYDMENDTLYSVKWYKGRREFYRYTPKENPAMKVFAMTSGLNVERNLSNQSHVVLQSVPLNISGKFTCEISVEAPSFQTAMVSGEMEVVELPEEHTTVTGIQARYRIGDLVDGNCSIKYSKPAANLTWTINGIVVPPHHIKTYQIEKHENSSLESVMSAIHFMVTTQHFLKGQMRLKCTASLFDIFKEEIESVIEEDRPRIMASGRSYDMNNYPFDQHSSGDGFEDHNESYLTYYSQNSGTSSASSAPQIFWQLWLRQLLQYAKCMKYASEQMASTWLRHIQVKFIQATTIASPTTDIGINDAPLRISCNKFDVWQLSVCAAVAFLWLTMSTKTTHQIIDCQYKRRMSRNGDGNGDSDANELETPSNTKSEIIVSSSSSCKSSQSSNNSNNSRKCFSNCQMATLSLQKCFCYSVECQKRQLCHQCLRSFRFPGWSNHSNQNDGSIKSGNDSAKTSEQLQLSATLAATVQHQHLSEAKELMLMMMMMMTTVELLSQQQRVWPSSQDQRLLITSKLMTPAMMSKCC